MRKFTYAIYVTCLITTAMILLVPAGCSGPDEKPAPAPEREEAPARLPEEKPLPPAGDIHWFGWDGDTFDAAEDNGSPVLLYIGDEYDIRAREVEKAFFSNPAISEKIGGYIPVRVYGRELPHVEACYGAGLKVITPEGEFVADVDIDDAASLPAAGEAMEMDRGPVCPAVAGKPPARAIDPAGKDEMKEYLEKLIEGFDPATLDLSPAERAVFYLTARRITKDETYLELAAGEIRELESLLDSEWGGVFEGRGDYAKWLDSNARAIDAAVMYAGASGEKTGIAGETVRYADSFLASGGGYMGGQAGGMAGGGGGVLGGAELFGKWGGRRDSLGMPVRDDNLYIVSNAMYAGALYRAADFYNRPVWRTSANELAKWLRDKGFDDGRGAPCFIDSDSGGGRLHGLLISNARLLRAFLDAYSGTGDSAWLQLAEELAGLIDDEFGAGEGGYIYGDIDDDIIEDALDEYTPVDGNSVMASELTRLYHITEEDDYHERAAAALAAAGNSVAGEKPAGGADFLEFIRAVYAFSMYPLKIAVIGGANDEASQELRRQASRYYEPNKVLMLFDPEKDADLLELHPYSARPEPTMFACVGTACSMPVSDPELVQDHLAGFVKRYMDDDSGGGLLPLKRLP